MLFSHSWTYDDFGVCAVSFLIPDLLILFLSPQFCPCVCPVSLCPISAVVWFPLFTKFVRSCVTFSFCFLWLVILILFRLVHSVLVSSCVFEPSVCFCSLLCPLLSLMLCAHLSVCFSTSSSFSVSLLLPCSVIVFLLTSQLPAYKSCVLGSVCLTSPTLGSSSCLLLQMMFHDIAIICSHLFFFSIYFHCFFYSLLFQTQRTIITTQITVRDHSRVFSWLLTCHTWWGRGGHQPRSWQARHPAGCSPSLSPHLVWWWSRERCRPLRRWRWSRGSMWRWGHPFCNMPSTPSMIDPTLNCTARQGQRGTGSINREDIQLYHSADWEVLNKKIYNRSGLLLQTVCFKTSLGTYLHTNHTQVVWGRPWKSVSSQICGAIQMFFF